MRTLKNTRKYRDKSASSSPVQLSFGDIITDPQKHRQTLACKPRKCLSCLTDFMSHGPGNRVCTRCKGLEAWSSSHPAEFSIAAF